MLIREIKPKNTKDATNKIDQALVICITTILAIGPVLDPYAIFTVEDIATIKILDIPMLLTAGLSLLRVVRSRLKPRYIDLLVLVLMFTVLTGISFIQPVSGRSFNNAIKNSIVNLVFATSISLMWTCWNRQVFIKIAVAIAIISSIILLYQYAALTMNSGYVFDGKISFLQLGKYDSWAPLRDRGSGSIRAHSIFQEPSYYAIYILPIFAWSLKNRKIPLIFLMLLGLVASSSLLSIMAGILVMIYSAVEFAWRRHVSMRQVIRMIYMLGATVLLFVILLHEIFPALTDTLEYYIVRIGRASGDLQSNRMGSVRYRLIGYLPHFSDYPLLFKLIGIGNNQFSSYLSVYPYSSVAVTVLLNYGLVGLTLFFGMIVSLYKRIPNDSRVYLFLFVIVCFVDYQWLNWYFFYIFTWSLTEPQLTAHQPFYTKVKTSSNRLMKSENEQSIPTSVEHLL